jgi:serine phosphatase RsbU (regulator of sigma subunit)
MGAYNPVRNTSVSSVARLSGVDSVRRRLANRHADNASPPVARPEPSPRYGAGAIATLSAVLVYFVATRTEIAVIERLRPGEMELTWISDAVLAAALGFAVFLWLHLKRARMTLSLLEREHIVLDTQLSMAASIQRGLLPPPPSETSGLRWAARLVQAGPIGGDLYDFVRSPAGPWLVLVGDVSGKGVPAALVLASIRTMFRMMTSETSDPGELVERISNRLYADHGGMPYFTCVVVRVDPSRREFSYVNAGHPDGIVLGGPTPGSPLILASCGPPAGLLPDQKYRTAVLAVPEGAVSVIVTDGITEALEALGPADGQSVAALVAAMPSPLVPSRICDALIDHTAAALLTGDWRDDRTVVAFALDSDAGAPTGGMS